MATTFVDYTGDGNATKAFSFPSIKEADVKVTVDEVLKSSGTHYNITSYTTTGGGNVVFTSGNIPASPASIRIFRDTDVDTAKATFVAGSSVKANDLNNNQTQLLYAVQEEQNIVSSTTTVKGYISAADKTKLDGIETAATADQTAAEIRTLVESATDSNVFTDADHAKLNAIEAGATGDQSNAEIRAAVEAASDSNVFTDADHSKLNAIEAGATADQTGAEIKTAYEAESDTNAYTDAEKTKLSGIETSATADQTSTEIKSLLASDKLSGADHITDYSIPNSKIVQGSLTGSEHATGFLNNANYITAGGSVGADKVLVYDASETTNWKWAAQSGSGGGGGTVSEAFKTIAVSGQNSVVADGATDTLNLAAGSNVTITTNDSTDTITIAASGGGGGSLSNVVEDTTPQLGGNLDVQASEIVTSTTNGNIKLTPDGTGFLEIKGNTNPGTLQLNCENNSHGVKIKGPAHSAAASYTLTLPDTDGSANEFLKTDGSGNLSWGDTTSTGDFKYLFLCPAGGTGAPTLDGSIATYDLRESSNSGSAASVTSAAQLLVSVNGVVQKANTGTSAPAEGFALVDSNTIIFGANLASGDSVFIVQFGSALSITTPGDGTVSTAKIAADAVTGAKIADDSIDSEHYVDGSIDTAHIGNLQVTEAKLASGAVTVNKLGADCVSEDKIADDAVREEHLADNAVTTARINASAVTTAKIADDAVTADKLANSINTEIAANTAKTTNATHTGEVTGGTALTIADDVVDEANLKVSNSPTNGYFLSAQSGNTGGLTWAEVSASITSDGAGNTVAGTNAGDAFSSGTNNTAFGKNALTENTSGYSNTAVGSTAGEDLTTAHGVTLLGEGAGKNITTGNNNTLMGYVAGSNITTGEWNTCMGTSAGDGITIKNKNTAIGGRALYGNEQQNNTAVGYNAAQANTTGYITAVGTEAATSHTTGDQSTAIGNNALRTVTTSNNNTAVGANALYSCTGANNTAVGRYANMLLTTADTNQSFGYGAGYHTTTGAENINLGGSPSTATASYEITLGNTAHSTLRCNDTSISSLSDRRDKTDIIDLPVGLDFLNTLKPRQFKWQTRDGNIKDGSTRCGFIAQEFQEAQASYKYLKLVMDENPNKLEANEGHLIPLLVKAIQELSAKVTALEAK